MWLVVEARLSGACLVVTAATLVTALVVFSPTPDPATPVTSDFDASLRDGRPVAHDRATQGAFPDMQDSIEICFLEWRERESYMSEGQATASVHITPDGVAFGASVDALLAISPAMKVCVESALMRPYYAFREDALVVSIEIEWSDDIVVTAPRIVARLPWPHADERGRALLKLQRAARARELY